MADRPAIAVRAVRTSVVYEDGEWMVRVRVEQGTTELPLFIGPFKDQATADREGRKIAKLVRKACGVADA